MGPPHRLDDGEALVDFVRHRLLAVNVFAGFHRVDHHAGVPMIGSGHDHRVDRFVVEQLAIVVEGLGAGRGFFQSALQVGFVDVADCRHLRADFLELPGQILAAPAGPDDAGANAVIRSQDAALSGGRG